MYMKNWKRRAAALLLAGATMAGLLSGCGKDGDAPVGGTDPGSSQTEAPEAPDGFVDNSVDPGAYKESEIYYTDPEKSAIIGVNEEQVYYKGSGLNLRLAVNMISSDEYEGGSAPGLPVSAIRDHVDYIRLGDREYQLDDLVRPRTDGFAVLERLAADFGVDKYAEDENGMMYLEGCLGKELSGDGLREAYSERADFEDYTVCVYYLHARMSGMDQAEQDKCRAMLQEAHGIDHSSLLDGTLAVMLYYDTNGYDLFYTVAVSAPCYWKDSEDFRANPDSQLRHDITNCMLMMDGSRPVGMVNQVFIRCDQDVLPEPEGGQAPDENTGDEGEASGAGTEGSGEASGEDAGTDGADGADGSGQTE